MNLNLPKNLVDNVNRLSALQDIDGSIHRYYRTEAKALIKIILNQSIVFARNYDLFDYADSLEVDFNLWLETDLSGSPDFTHSRDTLKPPSDGEPFFFIGPLRLANGAREGWKMECFLALREEPDGDAYKSLYELFPHPKNICQSSHLIEGSNGLLNGNNIVFFPENIQSRTPLTDQAYAVFFFNKFYDIFNELTLNCANKVISGFKPMNPTLRDRRENYFARCVWGYLHDYFHHQGKRPFDENISLKTRWYTGLLEEIKVDLQTWLACKDGDFIHADSVAEFILLDRAFRYPSEPDWYRNFDSGTGLLLLSILTENECVSIDDDGKINIDLVMLSTVARNFIRDVEHIETFENEEYSIAAKNIVREYLPEGLQGERIGLPLKLSKTKLSEVIGSLKEPLEFTQNKLKLSLNI